MGMTKLWTGMVAAAAVADKSIGGSAARCCVHDGAGTGVAGQWESWLKCEDKKHWRSSA